MSITERHNDLVLLQLTRVGMAAAGIEEINRDHIGFGQNLRLELSRRDWISVHDEHVEIDKPRWESALLSVRSVGRGPVTM